MIVRTVIPLLCLVGSLQVEKPLSRESLLKIANSHPPAENPSIEELKLLPFAQEWEERTIWTYFDGDTRKEKYRGNDYWSSDGRFHISRMTHLNGAPQPEEEQTINLTTYDAKREIFITYLLNTDDLIIAEGSYASEKKTLTLEGKSRSTGAALLCTMRIKQGNHTESNIDLYVDGERMATGRSRAQPLANNDAE
jgi:hypothetical protein